MLCNLHFVDLCQKSNFTIQQFELLSFLCVTTVATVVEHLETLVSNFIQRISCPPPKTRYNFTLGNTPMHCTRPPRSGLPMADDHVFTTLFQNLDPDNVAFIVACILSEQVYLLQQKHRNTVSLSMQ